MCSASTHAEAPSHRHVETAPLGLLVLQPVTFCNIDCSYCYLGQRSENHRMDIATVQAVARFVRGMRLSEPQLSVVWHAGEPLVAPVEFYEAAFDALQSGAAPMRFRHHFQTNGTLINDEWCSLFKRWSAHVGVSIDGPREIHDAHRVDRSKRGTFDRVMRGIAKLQDFDIPFTVIGVLTRTALQAPDDVWRFFETLGASQVAFNVEEIEGNNASSSLAENESEPLFRSFVQRLAALRAGNPTLRVREFDSMRNHLTAPPGSEMFRADNRPGAIINIDFAGNVTTFSPELLGLVTGRYGKFHWGNVHTSDWQDIVSSEGFRKAHEDIQAGVRQCEHSCSYFSVCGGGNPSNKLAELDTFAGTETQYCRLHVQAFADALIGDLEQEVGIRHEGEIALTQTEADRDEAAPRPNADIYLVGAGVAFPEHLTIETIEILSTCRRICTNLPEAMLQGLPQDLREKCVSLWPLYQDGRIRSENYRDVFRAIVEMVEIEAPVAWLTPGHPVIFDSVTALLIDEGKARGWNLRIIAGISSIDTMLATLGYDPAHGMLIHEATGLVRRRIPVSPSTALMLLQPAVFDVNVAIISVGSAGPDLSPLRDYLREFHSGEHMCAFIRSASQRGERDVVTWTKLSELQSVPYELVVGSTLFVPPASS